jgi:predicted Rossmann fold flavoprotein
VIYDIAIIGAGASGLMAASQLLAQDNSLKLCIIDTNLHIGAKIKISGGGKCNITNKYMNNSYFLGDREFVKNTLDSFTQNDLLAFLNRHNVYPKIEEKIVKGTYFCNSSKDITQMFTKLTKKAHYKLDTKVIDVDFKDKYIIKTNTQDIVSKKLIVASGGLSYANIGGSDIGYKIAKRFNHNIIAPSPALVGFTVQKDQFWFKSLSGLSLKVKINIVDKDIVGDMLFTHKGCSGPAILTTSLYWKKGKISIDFAPFKDSYLPKRFKKAIKELSKESGKEIDIHNYSFAPAGNFGYTKAEVTRGGVDTMQLTNNFESKIQKDLYFIGEVVDVTGQLGGYNFQWCFSSAYKLAKGLKDV